MKNFFLLTILVFSAVSAQAMERDGAYTHTKMTRASLNEQEWVQIPIVNVNVKLCETVAPEALFTAYFRNEKTLPKGKKVNIEGGFLKYEDGSCPLPYQKFAVDKDFNLYVHGECPINYLKKQPVLLAGECTVEDGKITHVVVEDEHYKVPLFNFYHILKYLGILSPDCTFCFQGYFKDREGQLQAEEKKPLKHFLEGLASALEDQQNRNLTLNKKIVDFCMSDPKKTCLDLSGTGLDDDVFSRIVNEFRLNRLNFTKINLSNNPALTEKGLSKTLKELKLLVPSYKNSEKLPFWQRLAKSLRAKQSSPIPLDCRTLFEGSQ